MVMRQGRTDSSHTERSFAYGSLANRSHSRRAGWGTESRVRDLPNGSEFAGQISLARTYPRGCARVDTFMGRDVRDAREAEGLMRLESTYTHTFTTSVTSDTLPVGARSSWPTSDSTPVSWSPRPRRVEGLTYYAPNTVDTSQT